MVISKLILNNAHRMNEQEMKGTRGGIGLNEYCCILYCITAHNYGDWSLGALNGALDGIDFCQSSGFGGSGGCQMSSGTCDYVNYY